MPTVCDVEGAYERRLQNIFEHTLANQSLMFMHCREQNNTGAYTMCRQASNKVLP